MAEVAAAGSFLFGAADYLMAGDQAKAQRELGGYQEKVANINAGYSEMAAAEAIEQGKKDVQTVSSNTAKTRGNQRAAYAGQGVKTDTGSAADIQEETSVLGALDELTVRNNARKQAWGYKIQAQNYRMSGKLAKAGAENSANSTLMTGGLSFLKGGIESAYDLSGGLNLKKKK